MAERLFTAVTGGEKARLGKPVFRITLRVQVTFRVSVSVRDKVWDFPVTIRL